MKKTLLLCSLLFVFVSRLYSYAHHPDNSLVYLRIYETAGIEGHFDINSNELNNVLGLRLPKYPTVEEVRLHQHKITSYLLKTAKFSSKYGNHNITFTDEISILRTDFGAFVVFPFFLEHINAIPDTLEVTFKTFIEEDPSHRNLLGIEYNWKSGLINNEAIVALDFSDGNWTKTLALTDTSVWKGFIAMIKQGVWHIWIGLDHILFLLALLLPAVVRRKKEAFVQADSASGNSKFDIWGWEPVLQFKPAFMYILKVITFFTIAHTITLTLASLQLINLPSQIVESVIALSIGLAAYHNIKPIFKGKDWLIAFVFGLFHGFGFSSVLAELGFKGEYLTLSLLGFNIGVEIGQVVIIAAIFPILYLIRTTKIYPKFLVFISGLLILISLYWCIERAFDINLPVDDYICVEGYKIAVYLGLR